MDRLTPLALRRAHSRVATPVIVEVYPQYFRELVDELSVYEFDVLKGILNRVRPFEFPLFMPTKIIPMFNMIAMVLPRDVIFDLAEDRRVIRIYSDELKFALQYPIVPEQGVYRITRRKKEVAFTSTYWTKRLIGADVANSKGYTGKGVKVAVLDTGASTVHEQLSGRVETYSVYYLQHLDSNGHGTWVTACVGGRLVTDDVLSRLSGKSVLCEGMAPETHLLAIKCLGYVVGAGSDSDIIKAVELALNQGAEILSMSLGGKVDVEKQEDDPHYKVMRKAVEMNTIPVVAAGNEGPEPGTIGSPGWLEDVLTVGAYDPITGQVAEYSSRGPTPDGRIKPDVIAPGGGIPDHGIDNAIVNLLDRAGDNVTYNRYSPIQGTSMATPHVSGLVACMRQAHKSLLGRTLTVEEIKRMMEQLGHEKNNDSGWGNITWQLYEQWLETEYGIRI